MEENKKLEQEEITGTCDCGENCNCETDEVTIDERLLELTLEKEYDRLEKRFLFDDKTCSELTGSDEFQEGISQALKICGMYSTLVSFGIDEDKAYELTLNAQTIEHNLKNTQMVNDTSIEVSKNQIIQVEKNTL